MSTSTPIGDIRRWLLNDRYGPEAEVKFANIYIRFSSESRHGIGRPQPRTSATTAAIVIRNNPTT